MLRRIFLTILLGFGATALLTADASAGGWRCGVCGQPSGRVYYAPPTYTYAQPTVTVVPHYIVRPHYVVEQTYVLRPTYYLGAAPVSPRRCHRGLLVNQGQYDTDAATVVAPSCY